MGSQRVRQDWACTQELQLNRISTPEGGVSHFATIPEPDKKEDSSFFEGKDSANEKPWALFTMVPQLPFPLYKNATYPSLAMCRLACDTPWWKTLNCNPLLIWNKSHTAGEISSHLKATWICREWSLHTEVTARGRQVMRIWRNTRVWDVKNKREMETSWGKWGRSYRPGPCVPDSSSHT